MQKSFPNSRLPSRFQVWRIFGFKVSTDRIDRVEDARDSQVEAQEQFKSALQQFGAVVNIENTNLKEAYEKLNAEYEDSKKATDKVSDRNDQVEFVADALFKEWEDELKLYKSDDLSYRKMR